MLRHDVMRDLIGATMQRLHSQIEEPFTVKGTEQANQTAALLCGLMDYATHYETRRIRPMYRISIATALVGAIPMMEISEALTAYARGLAQSATDCNNGAAIYHLCDAAARAARLADRFVMGQAETMTANDATTVLLAIGDSANAGRDYSAYCFHIAISEAATVNSPRRRLTRAARTVFGH